MIYSPHLPGIDALVDPGGYSLREPKKRLSWRRALNDEPIHVTDAAFEKNVLQATLPIIVDFWAPWCAPCKMIAPILDKIAKEYSGKLIIAKVNTDENPEWATKYGVQGIPTMLFFSKGTVVHRQVGALPEKMLKDTISQFIDVVDHST